MHGEANIHRLVATASATASESERSVRTEEDRCQRKGVTLVPSPKRMGLLVMLLAKANKGVGVRVRPQHTDWRTEC